MLGVKTYSSSRSQDPSKICLNMHGSVLHADLQMEAWQTLWGMRSAWCCRRATASILDRRRAFWPTLVGLQDLHLLQCAQCMVLSEGCNLYFGSPERVLANPCRLGGLNTRCNARSAWCCRRVGTSTSARRSACWAGSRTRSGNPRVSRANNGCNARSAWCCRRATTCTLAPRSACWAGSQIP